MNVSSFVCVFMSYFTFFHSYWNLGKDKEEFRFVSKNGNLNSSRLVLLQALSIVIRNGMSILGVSTPDKM